MYASAIHSAVAGIAINFTLAMVSQRWRSKSFRVISRDGREKVAHVRAQRSFRGRIISRFSNWTARCC